jgi:hypothetical protein
MYASESIWADDWASRIGQRVRDLGSPSVTDFLRANQDLPFFRVARLLGPDVAGVQVARLAFDEACETNTVRAAAMDAFCRVLYSNLKKGWNRGLHAERMMAGAYAEWLSILEFRTGNPGLRSLGQSVWNSLEACSPQEGWLPSGPTDPVVVRAFDLGWPKLR